MTLIEVLAATVLLAALAATSARVLQSVRSDSQQTLGTPFFELASLADSFIAEPAAFGVNIPLDKIGAEQSAIRWPNRPNREPVLITRVDPQSPVKDHAWLVFQHGSSAVSRYIPLSVKERNPR
jgi:hypothetical protein